MLKFFRRIRQKLLLQNRVTIHKPASPTSRYLAFAIGEIILVVVGILIALQINTWNINRLEKLEEIKILKSVKDELENSVTEFAFLNTIREKVIYCTKSIFELSLSTDLNHKKLDSLIGQTFYRPTFNNKLGTIDLMFSSGKINMIKNNSIRKFLISWPEYIEDMTEEEVYAMTLFQNQYYPLISKYIMVANVINQKFSTSFFGTELQNDHFSAIHFNSDYSGLLQDKAFYNHLRKRAQHMQINNSEIDDLILKAQTTIRMIDNEIKK